MAKVDWSNGIDSVSGALSKPSKSGQHSCTKMLLMRKKVKRSTPVKASEIQQRQRFGAIARAVNARAQDVSKIAADQAAYKAQKDTAGGKRTMKSYLWSLEMGAYDNGNPQG